MWKQLELESLHQWQLLPKKRVSIISSYLSQVLRCYSVCVARKIQDGALWQGYLQTLQEYKMWNPQWR